MGACCEDLPLPDPYPGGKQTAEVQAAMWPHQKMLWGGESSERVRLDYPGEGTHPMHQETFELNCSP